MILTKLFVEIDDFIKEYEPSLKNRLIDDGKVQRNRDCNLTNSEIMTIVVYFHISGYRNFKDYYTKHIKKYLLSAFPSLVSYERFVKLQSRIVLLLTMFMKYKRCGKCTGISYVDSTTIEVCHTRRIHQHRVFDGLAQRGKSSTGWFYGFKLHLVVSEVGDIIDFIFTPGNVSDCSEKLMTKLTNRVFGKLFGDKGYLSARLFNALWNNNIQMITKLKRNMKNMLMPLIDKMLLRKRALIESINDQLKNISQLEHTRHRSPTNAMVNWISALVAYSYQDKKPSINFTLNQKSMMSSMVVA